MGIPQLTGVDVMSVFKSVQSLSERVVEDFRIYQKAHNPSHLAHASACLREINELLGDGKLQLMITILDGIVKRSENGGRL